MVNGLSHYVAMLVELDAKQDILHEALRKNRNPFAEPCPSVKSNAVESCRGELHAMASHHPRRRKCGVVAQLAERVNGIHEVRGSNPLGSTTSAKSSKATETNSDNKEPGVIPLGPNVYGVVSKDGAVSMVSRKQLPKNFKRLEPVDEQIITSE